MDHIQAVHALIEWAEQHQRKAEAYRGLYEQMSQLAVTESSADGMVRVRVDAHRTLAAQAQDLVSAALPDNGDDAAAQIVASYLNRFGELTDNPRAERKS